MGLDSGITIAEGLEDREGLFVRVEVAVGRRLGSSFHRLDESLAVDEAFVLIHIQKHRNTSTPSRQQYRPSGSFDLTDDLSAARLELRHLFYVFGESNQLVHGTSNGPVKDTMYSTTKGAGHAMKMPGTDNCDVWGELIP